MAEVAPLEFHPFLADRFSEAVAPAAAVLVVDHDARPLERLLERVLKTDAKWIDAERAHAAIEAAAKAVGNLPKGTLPEDLIAAHGLAMDPHTGRDVVEAPPAWARDVNRVAAALCVCTGKTAGWNPSVLATTADGETLEQFVAAARRLTPEAHQRYGKLAAGMVAWMQGGELRGFLTRAEVPILRRALEADERQMFLWRERGGDFHRRKLQAFCYLAEKHGVGLAALVPVRSASELHNDAGDPISRGPPGGVLPE